MKKKFISLLVIAVIMTVTACKPVVKDTEERRNYDFESDYSKIADDDTHVRLDINNSVSVDADITSVKEGDKCGKVYDYERDYARVIDSSKLAERINALYGEEIVLTSNIIDTYTDKYCDELDAKIIQDGGSITYNRDPDTVSAGSYVGALSGLEFSFPQAAITERVDRLRKCTDQALELIQDTSIYKYSNDFQFYHVDDDVYNQWEKMYEEEPDRAAYLREALDGKELFYVRILPKLEDDEQKLISMVCPLGIYAAGEENLYDEKRVGLSWDDDSIWSYTESGIDIVFDSNMEIVVLQVSDRINYDTDSGDETKILSSKDIVKLIYDKFSKENGSNHIKITEISLNYTPQICGKNDDGTYKIKLAPIWCVKYYVSYSETAGEYKYYYYSAFDGSIFYGE